MKNCVALTVVSLALMACGKEENKAPTGATPAPAAATASAPEPMAGSAAAATPAASGATTYTVVKGDTLIEIARSRGMSAADLASWNDIRDPRRLRIGQQLRLTPP